MTSCILLAAGLSERFGSPKALAIINGTTAIEQLQQQVLNSCCDELIIVLGAFSDLILPHVLNHKRIRVVHNNQYKFGQTSSFQTGLQTLHNTLKQHALLLPVDCPFLKSSSINTICKNALILTHDVLIPSYAHHRGHPPIFNKRAIDLILKLPLDHGINTLFSNPALSISSLEINDLGITKTFNTPQELEQIKRDAR